MAIRKVKARAGAGLTRREMLRAAAAAGLGALVARVRGEDGAPPTSTAAAATSHPATQPASAASTAAATSPWWLGPEHPRSRVVHVQSQHVLLERKVEEPALTEMVETSIQVLTGARTSEGAWRAILGDARQIAVKFNRVGADVLNTNEPMARSLLRSLKSAGYSQDRVALIEVDAEVRGLMRVPTPGWGEPIAIGDARDDVANWFYEADAVINVGLLKTHQIAGMSGAMKNISHGIVRHPARMHANGCTPFVGQVISQKEVSTRLRLHVINALRVVVRNGPDARREDTVECGHLLMGFDPVAVDVIGREYLTMVRNEVGLKAAVEVPYLEAAMRAGVGRGARHELDPIPVTHGG